MGHRLVPGCAARFPPTGRASASRPSSTSASWATGPAIRPEALVHLPDGVPLKAVNPQNQYVPIAHPATGGEEIHYLVEAASNPDILANDFAGPTRSAKPPRGR